jgi:hypothetical protein
MTRFISTLISAFLLLTGAAFAEPRIGDLFSIKDEANGNIVSFTYEGGGKYRNMNSGGTYITDANGNMLQRSDGTRFLPNNGQAPPGGAGTSWDLPYEVVLVGGQSERRYRSCTVVKVDTYTFGELKVEGAIWTKCTDSSRDRPFMVDTTIDEVWGPSGFSGLPLVARRAWPARGNNPGGGFASTMIEVRRAPSQVSQR